MQILNVGPGVMQGDVFELNIRVKSGAGVALVNQSATKLHTMPKGVARQTTTIHVEQGAELELYPGLVIPYREADYHQHTDVHLEEGARFGLLERWSMGRVAYGEAFTFRRLSSRLSVSRENRLIYADGLELTPPTAPRTGTTDRHTYLASGVWLWGEVEGNLYSEDEVVRPAFSETSLVQGSFGEGLYMRCLGSDGLEHSAESARVVQRWREASELTTVDFGRFGQGL